MTLEERIAIIENKANNRKQQEREAIMKKQEESNKMTEKIKALQPRIESLLKLMNKCIELDIDIPDKYKTCEYGFGNGSITFYADGFYHQVGFMGKSNIFKDKKPVKYIGFYNGGACGPWDFYTNGKDVFSEHEDRKEVKTSELNDLKKFLTGFDKFEDAFYKWIDSIS